ncbi:hypothetical protein [Sphingobacterium sp. UBA6320]|uniref:Cap15 family cyclic dinucleotide receptor domain-containing protein n=1 Tax=Sphingobacterium sp. UBA6320 TaxID=1947510 RepID=UPI0025E5FC73|nr:hypothetical protein [Sphingobacterium sp. UBA6320]
MNFKYYKTSNLIISILVLSLLIAPGSKRLESLIQKSEYLNSIYSYIGNFSTVAILTLFLILINNILWKYVACKWLVDLPNLNGRYQGELTSTYIDPQSQLPVRKKCIIEICQNASEIKIHSYYGDHNSSLQSSESISVSEEIRKLSNGFFEIFYIFSNTANTSSPQLDNHIGTCQLKYHPDLKSLVGEYYNKRGYKGRIDVTFVQKTILGRFN